MRTVQCFPKFVISMRGENAPVVENAGCSVVEKAPAVVAVGADAEVAVAEEVVAARAVVKAVGEVR